MDGESAGRARGWHPFYGYGNQRMALGETFHCGGHADGGGGLLSVVVEHLEVLDASFLEGMDGSTGGYCGLPDHLFVRSVGGISGLWENQRVASF